MPDEPANPYHRGACPGAGAPMQSGDGLLSRVRLPGGRISVEDLAFLAEQAEAWGRPVLELTSRGNLQIRGLSAEGDARMTAALVDRGLAVTPAASEAARNLLSSPAADLDPQALADPWPVAGALDDALSTDERFRSLPGKFRMLVNGGGVTHLADQDADVRADAMMTPEGIRYRIAIAGSASGAKVLGYCLPERTPDVMLAVARRFLELNATLFEPAKRLAGLLDETGAGPFRELLNAQPSASLIRLTYTDGPVLGPQPGWFGAAVPFGEISTQGARALAALALTQGMTQVRVTPWRQVLFPGAGADLEGALRELGLITQPGDARLSAIACPGAPACASGTGRTRDDALAWARALPALFDGELKVHVSGCGKGCANPMANPLTLTARHGLYDLIVNDRADPRDGNNRLLEGLAPDDVADRLGQLAAGLQRERGPNESLASTIRRLGAPCLKELFVVR